MRIEGDDQRASVPLFCMFDGLLNDVLVASVKTVKHANRAEYFSTRFLELVEVGKDLHLKETKEGAFQSQERLLFLLRKLIEGNDPIRDLRG